MKIQLLISVTNVQEALLAIEAGVDIVDLKDPAMGALGALPLTVIADVVRTVNKRAIVSATVGEHHPTIEHLCISMKQTSALGVDIVKIALSTNLLESIINHAGFFNTMQMLNKQQCKVVAVLFADQLPDAIDIDELINKISQLGFYGLMLDTASKNGKCLFDYQLLSKLQGFVDVCRQHQLMSGLAGSLQLEHLNSLLALNPCYIGFRGGVCKKNDRKLALDQAKILEINNVVKKYKISVEV